MFESMRSSSEQVNWLSVAAAWNLENHRSAPCTEHKLSQIYLAAATRMLILNCTDLFCGLKSVVRRCMKSDSRQAEDHRTRTHTHTQVTVSQPDSRADSRTDGRTRAFTNLRLRQFAVGRRAEGLCCAYASQYTPRLGCSRQDQLAAQLDGGELDSTQRVNCTELNDISMLISR